MTIAFWVCVIVLIVTQIADYYSSKFAMRNLNALEANWFVRTIGLLPMKIAGSVLYVLIAYVMAFIQVNITLLIAITIGITVFYSWVILHNFNIGKDAIAPTNLFL